SPTHFYSNENNKSHNKTNYMKRNRAKQKTNQRVVDDNNDNQLNVSLAAVNAISEEGDKQDMPNYDNSNETEPTKVAIDWKAVFVALFLFTSNTMTWSLFNVLSRRFVSGHCCKHKNSKNNLIQIALKDRQKYYDNNKMKLSNSIISCQSPFNDNIHSNSSIQLQYTKILISSSTKSTQDHTNSISEMPPCIFG
ncbi:hypothetical protein RFI_05696, partial [Reticulomyxa filosa]